MARDGMEVGNGIEQSRVHSPWFASMEAKVARMTVQVPAIQSGPAVQPCAGVAGEGSQERGQIRAALKTSLEHPRALAFL